MKANKAKSKFVYPDKLYARCKDNKTLDISYAPQNMDAVEYTRTDAFIEKVENFLEMLGYGFTITDNITHANYDKEQLIEDFKNYMKGEYSMATVKDFKKALNELLSKLDEYADDTKMVIVLDDNCGGSYPDSIGSFSLDYDGEVVSLNNL